MKIKVSFYVANNHSLKVLLLLTYSSVVKYSDNQIAFFNLNLVGVV